MQSILAFSPVSKRMMFLSLITLLLSYVTTFAAGYGTVIDPGTRECFLESVAAGGSLAFMFRVTDGGSFDLDVTMHATTAPPLELIEDTTRMHYSERLVKMRENTTTVLINDWRRASEGTQTYTAPSAAETKHGLPAEISVCFDNSFSRVSPKWVLFQFLKRDVPEIDPDSLSKTEAEIEKKLHRYGTVLFDLATAAERMRQMGEADRAKHESLAGIITAGLVGNIVILLVMAVYQYTTLTRFLARRRAK